MAALRRHAIYNTRMNSMAETSAADPRLAALRNWLVPRFGRVELRPASTDASFRRYFRIQHDGDSYIVMDAPPAHEDCRSFIDIACRLAQSGVHVPHILDADLEQGFLLLTDLGETAYLQMLTEANADTLYADAIEALLKIQQSADTTGLPDYDHSRLMQELQLFPDWYLGRHLDMTLTPAEAGDLDAIFEALLARALAQPAVFVHRDYMPRNLMYSDPNPGVLDFQDAVLGPISYDVLSLFKDAFISWPETRVNGWIQDYWQQARHRGLPVPDRMADFQIDLDWMGLQRHLKVLGIFARICYRDGKPHYIRDAWRFVSYVLPVAERYPELAPLADLFRHRVLPLLERD